MQSLSVCLFVCLFVCLSVDLNHSYLHAVRPGQASRGAAETEGGGAWCGGSHCSAHQQTSTGAALRQEHHCRNTEVCGRGDSGSVCVCIHVCMCLYSQSCIIFLYAVFFSNISLFHRLYTVFGFLTRKPAEDIVLSGFSIPAKVNSSQVDRRALTDKQT